MNSFIKGWLRLMEILPRPQKSYIVEESVKALAIYYDLRDVIDRVRDRGRWSVRDLEDAVVRLSKILGEWLRRAWEAAYYLHVEGFHERRLGSAGVRERVGDVERVIEEIKKIIP